MASEVHFADYEGDLLGHFKAVESKISELSDNSPPASVDGTTVKKKLADCNKLLGKAEAVLLQMELEIRAVHPNNHSNNDLTEKIARHRKAFRSFGDDLRRLRRLLVPERDPKGAEQRQRLLEAAAKADSSTRQLEEARRAALETEEVGVVIVNDLSQQRATLEHAGASVRDLGRSLDAATLLTSRMMRRAQQHKYLTMVIVGAFLLTVVFIGWRNLSAARPSTA